MTFDELRRNDFCLSMHGMELAGLYVLLAAHEEHLDEAQIRVLERVRTVLYAHLSIEDIEDIETTYKLF